MRKNYALFSLLFLLGLLVCNVAQGQKEIPSKDILYLKDGSIKVGTMITDKNSILNQIEFKESSGSIFSYTTSQFDSILLESNEKFIRKKLLVKSDTISKPEQIVQILFKGEFNLLKSENQFYFETKNGDILGPLQKKETNTTSNKGKSANSNNVVGLLSYLFSGECNLSLKSEIEKIQLKDPNLVELLKEYHECKRIEYVENLSNQPKFRASWIIQAGIMKSDIKITSNSLPTTYEFDNNFAPFFLIGKRLDLFKESPRLSMDIMIGYSNYTNSINYRHETLVVNVSGEGKYTNHSISTNWFLNHTFLKSKSVDLYLGAGVINRLPFSKKDFETVEYEVLVDGIPIQRTSDVIKITPFTFSPSLKFGSILQKNNNSRLSIETRVDYTPNYMNLNLTRTVAFNSLNYGLFVNYSFLKSKG